VYINREKTKEGCKQDGKTKSSYKPWRQNYLIRIIHGEEEEVIDDYSYLALRNMN
jgi:hypothetical protein